MIKRNTKTKQLILESLKKTKSAVSQETLQKELGESVDRATIYRVLNSFCDDGIIHKILSDDGKFYFAFCVNCSEKAHKHNHFHFRCLQCGKIECLPNEVDIKLPQGYQSVNFNGFISGYCSNCS
ncbi:Fur family transcriptional regulator [Chryseobacterium defluvii]|uniref:Fur family ferric uptake transcriptional regulator n=1 Tax=Chryseobacterium defluvii TaxID=160396 RepID=A0A495SP90_9FLAO|nr:transcriptional repressor [Chryseobacterium defluvii]RKT01322.1 Fur family ferric uptake transcriptional regulator [Chryseobacterium defluvii]